MNFESGISKFLSFKKESFKIKVGNFCPIIIFLLDHQGKIIRKNIALEELERILEQISESDK